MRSLILLRKMLATLDRARRENRPYWFALTVPRHTFASHAAIQQENTPMIAKLLGHSGTDNTQRYMHLVDQPALDAAELVSGLLWAALTGSLAGNACRAMLSRVSEHPVRMASLDAERPRAYLTS